MKSIPETLRRAMHVAHAAMEAHPGRHLAPHLRRALYDAIGPLSVAQPYRVRAQLAIRTAEHVLPIYTAAPFDLSIRPQHLLAVARGLLCYATASTAGVQVQPTPPESPASPAPGSSNAFFAAAAAQYAEWEACGREPLLSLDQRFLVTSEAVVIPADRWTDEQLAGTSIADTASAAAIAAACVADDRSCDPARLRAFWEWWLLEAIPEAWEAAHAGRV